MTSKKNITFSPNLGKAIDELRRVFHAETLKNQLGVELIFCIVKSVEPLELLLERNENIVIKKGITVSEKVTDHYVEFEADPTHTTESESSIKGNDSDFSAHSHNYKGGLFLAKYGLKTDDRVAVLCFDRGQRYLILDRVNNEDDTK